MTHEATRGRGRPSRVWHGAAALAFVVAGALFATTALSAKGLDLRAASITDLDGVVRQEKQRSDELQGKLASLHKQVDELGRQVNDTSVTRLQGQVDQLRGPAGLDAVTGPGLTVVLSDAPKSEIDKARADDPASVDLLVVHQQDIQAVVNALWSGGAEAMTIQGQRVVSTTGIKCVGNTVVLHGVPYSPPYRIAAIGDPAQLESSLDASDYIDAYQTFVQRYSLGYDVLASGHLELPAYKGSTTLKYAEPGVESSSGQG
ncbi:DUF881 domain-containing protein [Nocardioides pocheonensis]|uniref:DUF881 domain-containing protein n=1 Tax=Nocardioides pocheonensis TaxID=661485 RepID=UPI001FE76AFF|nr:DUF881 domain-containing protein [Nocardioides pocheonensis]